MAEEKDVCKAAGILCLVLCLQLAMIAYWGNRKAYYHIDEFLTYYLANCDYTTFSIAWLPRETWLDRKYFYERSTAQPGHEFKYLNPYINQIRDVHPPLYYMAIHTVCSFFPGIFSKWTGIAVNTIFFLLTQLTLYALARKLLQDNIAALVPCMLYGCSPGCLSMIFLARMYMMLSFFCLLAFYLHVCLLASWHEEKQQRTLLPLLSAVYFLGFMTHYYFLVFSGVLSGFFLLYLYRKRLPAKAYVRSTAGGMLLGCLCYPAALKHIFWDYRGRESFSNLLHNDFVSRLGAYLDILDKAVSWKTGCAALVLALGIQLTTLLRRKSVLQERLKAVKERLTSGEWRTAALVAALAATLVPFLVISKIAVFTTDRYISFIYPLVMLLIYYGLDRLIKRYFKPGVFYLTCIFIFFVAFYGTYRPGISYLYENYHTVIEKCAAEDTPDHMLVITETSRPWRAMNIYGFFLNMEKVWVTEADSIQSFPWTENKLLVCLDRRALSEKWLADLGTQHGMTLSPWAVLDTDMTIYLLERTTTGTTGQAGSAL